MQMFLWKTSDTSKTSANPLWKLAARTISRWGGFLEKKNIKVKVESVTNSIWHSATDAIDAADGDFLFIHKRSKTCQHFPSNARFCPHISRFSYLFYFANIPLQLHFYFPMYRRETSVGGFLFYTLLEKPAEFIFHIFF